ncbi:S-adenosyl-L-methionine-dependent methyltransferase [Mycena epipterygia]|nr:S-adenosyl-L-methionine-dependent methyltransferase [Mycena epipterygia]
MAQLQKELSYTLKTAQEAAEKNRRVHLFFSPTFNILNSFRLDEVHFALREYLDDKICFAPIYGTSPGLTRILEIGCGSGVWAIDAATDFPDAEVVAVDLSPLPDIPLPKNINFQIVDVTQNLPFEEETFDVVHARLVLMHVPNGKDVLERAAKLVKPGGWLLVDDLNMRSMVEKSGPVYREKMESIIRSTGSFSEIDTHKISIPICHNGSVPQNMRRLGVVFNKTVKKVVDDWSQRFSEQGITNDLAEQYKKELDTNSHDVIVDMHFAWARRAL